VYIEGACCLLFSVSSVLHLVLFCYDVPCFPCAGVHVTELLKDLRIFEKIAFNGLQYEIDVNNILAQQQYGFRTKLTTDLAIFTLINKILLALIRC
jgi:hypothetical protein